MILDKKLDDYLEVKKREPFEWGKCDCTLFAADWCEVISGINPAQGSHGAYDTKESSKVHLLKKYGNKPYKIADKLYPRVELNFQQKGDVALCELNDEKIFGIVGTNGFVIFKTGEGLLATKLAKIKIIWRVK